MRESDVRTARSRMGGVGLFLPAALDSVPPVADQRDAVRRLESAGCTTVWVNETVGSKDALVQLALLLDVTDRMTFGTGIANVWARPPQTMHAAAAMLAQAHPDRVVLGLGVGYPEQARSVGRSFGRPRATMRDYLAAMDTAPGVAARYPRLVAANGPGMLGLAAESADGALPAMQPPAFTQQARRTLGDDKLLVVLQRLEPDAGPDAGPTDDVRSLVAEHLAAGADHVALALPLGVDFAAGVDRAVQVAEQLASSR